MVWGDTSAFQGVSTYYPRVVGPMLAWLSRPAAWTERPVVRLAAATGLLAAIALALALGGDARAIRCRSLAGSGWVWRCLGCSACPVLRAHVPCRRMITVLLDKSHFPASGHYNAHVNPVGPLYTNLLRSGFRVAELEDWDPAAIAKARGIAFVAPQRSFTAGEVADLFKAEERGAVAILTAGQPDAAGSRGYSRPTVWRSCPRPMGTVTPVARPRAAASAKASRDSSTPGRSWPPMAATRPLCPESRSSTGTGTM